MSEGGFFSVLAELWRSYRDDTPRKLKLIDAYLAYIMATGIIQFLYCCLVGTFPFNSFLSGFISTVASFILGGEELEHVVFEGTIVGGARSCYFNPFMHTVFF